MYTIPDDAREVLVQEVNRPAWQGEPTVLLFAHPNRHEAALEWWRDTVGEGPSVDLRNALVDLPERKLTPDGREVREFRTASEPADLALVEAEYVDKWRPVLATRDVPVVALEVKA